MKAKAATRCKMFTDRKETKKALAPCGTASHFHEVYTEAILATSASTTEADKVPPKIVTKVVGRVGGARCSLKSESGNCTNIAFTKPHPPSMALGLGCLRTEQRCRGCL